MLHDLYIKYLELRQLLGHEEALQHFDYLHAITLSRLRAYIESQQTLAG